MIQVARGINYQLIYLTPCHIDRPIDMPEIVMKTAR